MTQWTKDHVSLSSCICQDILNNLDSCDLDDDDLMLDSDALEEASLHSGKFVNISPFLIKLSQHLIFTNQSRHAAVWILQMETALHTWLSGGWGNSAGERRTSTMTMKGERSCFFICRTGSTWFCTGVSTQEILRKFSRDCKVFTSEMHVEIFRILILILAENTQHGDIHVSQLHCWNSAEASTYSC